MRIALISALKRTPAGELRAEQELAGRSVLEWQVDLALDFRCERIICLCDTSHGEVIAQQRRIEADGLAFHAVRNHLQLGSLVRTDDDVLAQLDGLVLGDAARELIHNANNAAHSVVITIAANHRLSNTFSNDFERIDRDSHWAGVALVPGECAADLEDMPGEGDAMSLLLRLGLQAKVSCETVPPSILDNDQWLFASDSEALERRAGVLLKSSLSQPYWSGPSGALAAAIVRATAPFWLKTGSEIGAGLAIAVMVLAGILVAAGYGIAGLCVGAIGAFIVSLSTSSVKLRTGVSTHARVAAPMRLLVPASAGLATILLILAYSEATNWSIQIGVPIFTIGLAWVAQAESNAIFGAFWRDLPTHLAIFAFSMFFGILQEAMLVFSLGALLQLMLRTRHQSAKIRS